MYWYIARYWSFVGLHCVFFFMATLHHKASVLDFFSGGQRKLNSGIVRLLSKFIMFTNIYLFLFVHAECYLLKNS